jgi:ABC-type nickel/cobalt efflux system permease component RcnA
VVTALALAAVAAPPASAHPLGNFSVNHLVRVRADAGAVHLHYILDQAEIPTFQERGLAASAVLAAKLAEVRRHLAVRANGRPVRLRVAPGARLSHPPGQGGLPLTRVELDLTGAVPRTAALTVHDGTFPGRIGWKAIVAAAGSGATVRSDVPAFDPTRGLRAYPKDALQSPSDVRTARLAIRPGAGTLVAPRSPFQAAATTTNRAGDGLAGVFGRAADGRGVLVLLLFAALGWGALHALSPGHGKAMVAAYLVGTRGTPRHALALGATVTLTHTAGVFALGLVTLALSAYVLPEDLYPWLNLVSGLLVVGIGAGVLRSRLRRRHHHAHNHDHDHDHHPHHARDHDHHHAHHHHRGHDHDLPHRVTWRGLVAMGASAGLIPCPSALVVLLAAVGQHQIALGLLLIVAFSLGLAATLSALGLAAVWARGALARAAVSGPVVALLPAASAVVIVGAGVVLTARAVVQL